MAAMDLATYLLTFLSMLVLGAFTTAAEDRCLGVTECIPVIDHSSGTAWLGCFFPEDLRIKKQEMSLQHYPFGTSTGDNASYVFGCNWLKNGSVYCQGNEGYELLGDVSDRLKILIPDPKPKHEGYYSCILVQQTAVVAPIPCFMKFPVPQAPQNIACVKATENTAIVRWTTVKQESVFAELPLTFRVRIKKTSALDGVFRYDDVSPPGVTEYTITGLEPSTWYEVSVSASNMFGWGPYQKRNETVLTKSLPTAFVAVDDRKWFGIGFVVGLCVGAILGAVIGILVYINRAHLVKICCRGIGRATTATEPGHDPALECMTPP